MFRNGSLGGITVLVVLVALPIPLATAGEQLRLAQDMLKARSSATESTAHGGWLRHRISLCAAIGSTSTALAGNLADEIEAAGFGDTTPGGCGLFFCGGPVSHPTKEDPQATSAVSLRFLVRPDIIAGIGFSSTTLGGATGFQDNASGGILLNSDWESKAFWIVGFWTPNSVVRVGGGPSFYSLRGRGYWDYIPRESKISRIGAVLEAGLEFPHKRWYFVDLAARFHYVPGKDVEHGDGSSTLSFRPSWSYGVATVGIGIRI